MEISVNYFTYKYKFLVNGTATACRLTAGTDI